MVVSQSSLVVLATTQDVREMDRPGQRVDYVEIAGPHNLMRKRPSEFIEAVVPFVVSSSRSHSYTRG